MPEDEKNVDKKRKTMKGRQLAPAEYQKTRVGIYDKWTFNLRDDDAKTRWNFVCRFIRTLRWATWSTKLLRVRERLRMIFMFLREMTRTVGGRFWVIAAIRLLQSFRDARQLLISGQVTLLISTISKGKPLNARRLGRLVAEHVALEAASCIIDAYCDTSERIIRRRMELVIKRQILRTCCRLDDDSLADKSNRERIVRMQQLEHFDPFNFVTAVTDFTSIFSEIMAVCSELTWDTLPLLLGTLTIRLSNKIYPYYIRDFGEDTANDDYARMATLYAIGTKSGLRREVVSLNLQDYLESEFDACAAKLQDVPVLDVWDHYGRTSTWRTVFDNSTSMFTSTMYGLYASFNSNLQMSYEQLHLLSSSMSMLTWRFKMIGGHPQSYNQVDAIEAYYECQDLVQRLASAAKKAKIAYTSNTTQEGEAKGMQVEFRNVSFKYPDSDKHALTDVSLVIRPGQLVSIVGHNGSGKTTLMSLLSMLKKPAHGQILLNGHLSTDYAPTDLLTRMSFSFQTSPSFPITIKETIGLGDVKNLNNDERIRKVLKDSGAEEAVLDLPEGWHSYPSGVSWEAEYGIPRVVPREEGLPRIVLPSSTPSEADDDEIERHAGNSKCQDAEKDEDRVWPRQLDVKRSDMIYWSSVTLDHKGEKVKVEYPQHQPECHGLSGGQWQRVTLAQSLMNPLTELRVFDEPSAFLDPEAEAALFEAVLKLRGSSTILFSTHRLGVTRQADLILVFDHGRLVEQGTHAELLSIEGGYYKKMWDVQAKGFAEQA